MQHTEQEQHILETEVGEELVVRGSGAFPLELLGPYHLVPYSKTAALEIHESIAACRDPSRPAGARRPFMVELRALAELVLDLELWLAHGCVVEQARTYRRRRLEARQ